MTQSLGFAAEVSLCPTIGPGRVYASAESLLERRWKHVVRQGLDISCGSAALATILRYHYGHQVREDLLIQQILKKIKETEIRKRGGFSLLDLKRVAVGLGYQVKGYKLTLDQLKTLSRPALVPITIRRYRHFVVVRGIIDDRVVLADPSFGNTLLDLDQFGKMWERVVMVIVKDGKGLPPSKLEVSEDDLSIAETQEALRSFLNRTTVHTVVEPDEF